jgi:hypothetical protein
MNIIEEQTMNDDTNPRISGNMDAGPSAPSAKKVYTKPRLVILNQSVTAVGKQNSQFENPHPTQTLGTGS